MNVAGILVPTTDGGADEAPDTNRVEWYDRIRGHYQFFGLSQHVIPLRHVTVRARVRHQPVKFVVSITAVVDIAGVGDEQTQIVLCVVFAKPAGLSYLKITLPQIAEVNLEF